MYFFHNYSLYIEYFLIYMKFIESYKSSSFDLRTHSIKIKYLIIHYTAMRSHEEAIKYLCNKNNKVSSHFLINKTGDVFNLVNLSFRAWHAGKSFWKKESDINSSSLGIELDNSGHFLDFENFSALQIEALIKLIKYLKKKYKIKPHNILGHSDIAPYRKFDPGEKFPWKKLYNKDICFFPLKLSISRSRTIDEKLNKIFAASMKSRSLYMLEIIGYNVSTSFDDRKYFKMLIRAYQMHYMGKDVTGILNKKTYEIIKAHYNHVLTN